MLQIHDPLGGCHSPLQSSHPSASTLRINTEHVRKIKRGNHTFIGLKEVTKFHRCGFYSPRVPFLFTRQIHHDPLHLQMRRLKQTIALLHCKPRSGTRTKARTTWIKYTVQRGRISTHKSCDLLICS